MRRARPRLAVAVLLLAVVGGGLALGLRAQPQAPADPPTRDERTVVQGFPARSADPRDPRKSDTAWVVEWDITSPYNGPGFATPPASVLRIASAVFMSKDRTGQPRWITVARDLRIGEMFVPYDPGSPRFQDVANHPFWITRADDSFLGPNCVAPGRVLRSTEPTHDRKVYCEVHDDGPRWISDGGYRTGDRARRGEKLILWAVFYGANYRYLMEYNFLDDGSITCRAGATARNIFDRRDDQGDIHLHVGCWRFDPDLGDPTNTLPGGPDKNVVRLVRRVPRTPAAEDGKFKAVVEPFASVLGDQANEGAALWQAEEFTSLRIESTVRKNGQDMPGATAYDLMPLRNGTIRHFPPRYDWVNKDFWVTLSEPSQTTFSDVATYAERQRPIDGKPVTVWHSAAALHVPRGEDFGPDGRDSSDSIALTAWCGFTLRPRNLFDRTPLYSPSPSRARSAAE